LFAVLPRSSFSSFTQSHAGLARAGAGALNLSGGSDWPSNLVSEKNRAMSSATTEKTGPNATVDIAGLRNFIRDNKLGDPNDLRSENI
jgi:hypothetical protein